MVTVAGMVTAVRAVPLKAELPMEVMAGGSCTWLRLVQSAKILFPIAVIPLGSVMLVSDLQFWKALEPIVVTVGGREKF